MGSGEVAEYCPFLLFRLSIGVRRVAGRSRVLLAIVAGIVLIKRRARRDSSLKGGGNCKVQKGVGLQ